MGDQAGPAARSAVPFSHKHHVEGLGLQCQYCHTSVEKSAYAGIPPTKTCINCHSQIWTNAELLRPVRESWATNASINWIRVHDLPDYVYFNHEIHVNKGIGCSSCHGRVDQMPLMYQESSLQMEWCLNCHRNPGVNLRPTTEIYNMAWAGPSTDKPVWCSTTANTDGTGVPTAQGVSCVTKEPTIGGNNVAQLETPSTGAPATDGVVSDAPSAAVVPVNYVKFTSQNDLGKYLTQQYHIRGGNELSSCEVCHR